METIKLGIVDDDKLIVELLAQFFDNDDQFSVELKCFGGLECLEALKQLDELPEMILIDLKMSGMDGTELLQEIRAEYPQIKCVVISSFYQRSFMGYLLKSGAVAFLAKGIAPEELKGILLDVHKKGYYFLPDQLEIVREQLSSKIPRPVLNSEDLLSEREKEILILICRQKTAIEIGEILFIAQRTVEGHKNHMYAKTGAKNLAGLVIYAIQNQIINSDEIIML
jgi:DNA-binding NarL/FixJ family response regulator